MSVKINRDTRQKMLLLVIVAIIVLVTGAAAYVRSNRTVKLDYSKSLDLMAYELDGKTYTMKDLAVYIAIQESAVESQARAYDPDDTNKYWNSHTNGKFIRVEARELAVKNAIHDSLFYELAMEENIELTPEEEQYLAGRQEDFWMDLSELQRSRICISKEEAEAYLTRMAYAQKKQQLLAQETQCFVEDYDVDGAEYEKLLEEHTYQINDSKLEQLDFGNITLSHERNRQEDVSKKK